MNKCCDWCDSENIHLETETVYWELPDGSRAIEITETPAVVCHDCAIIYQTDEVTKNIEDQLFLVDTTKIGKTISYVELLALPRLLKRNYFDF